MPLSSLELEIVLGSQGNKVYQIEAKKLRDLRINLDTVKSLLEQRTNTFKIDRYKNSVEFHQKQLDNHTTIWKDRKTKMDDTYERAKRELEDNYIKNKESYHIEETEVRATKEANLAKAKRLFEDEITRKPMPLIMAEAAITKQITKMMADLPLPRHHFPELIGDKPIPLTQSFTSSSVVPLVITKENELIQEYIKEKGEAPVMKEELELFIERRNMLALIKKQQSLPAMKKDLPIIKEEINYSNNEDKENNEEDEESIDSLSPFARKEYEKAEARRAAVNSLPKAKISPKSVVKRENKEVGPGVVLYSMPE